MRPIPLLVCGLAIALALGLVPRLIPNVAFQIAITDLVPFVLLGAICFLCLRNAFRSLAHRRLFWSLMTVGTVMWWLGQAAWIWYEVVLRKPLPQHFAGDIVLFLHIVPIMGAVAIHPHEADENDTGLVSALNVCILAVWWVAVYAFFVFPEQYLADDRLAYTARWDILYAAEGSMLIVTCVSAYASSRDEWRKLFGGIGAASVLNFVTTGVMYTEVASGANRGGSLRTIPLLASSLTLLWVAWIGRVAMDGTLPSKKWARHAFADLFGQTALLSLPVIGYVALFMSHDTPFIRHIRFEVAMGGVAVLACFVFLKQYLLDRRLLQLLDRSRRSFDRLQRLQGRAVQQAKLASLGELVALAAGELEHPLTVILENSARLASSSHLTREQLANAQKIGQQARRTHELVGDLLSFSQQSPGEKVPLELRPLVQRALQMEGFKLDNRNIVLSVDPMDSLPRVLGNSSHLLQAFVQIVENAMDALQEVGGGRLQVSAWREEEEVVIQFADNGPGLQAPERVFDPFYTTKAVGKGTGLGLSATYGVIQDHKGQISCFNRPEGGAAFEIRLPALKTGSAASASTQA